VVTLPVEPLDVLETDKTGCVKTLFSYPAGNLSFMLGGGDFSCLGFTMVYRSDGVVTATLQNVLENFYFNAFRNRFVPVFTKAVKNLWNIRNHLLLQLDLEYGNISEEYFDREESKYLTEIEKISPSELKDEINVLLSFTELFFDSGDISEILNCSVDDAEKALTDYLDGV
jgi:hypothetical protein